MVTSRSISKPSLCAWLVNSPMSISLHAAAAVGGWWGQQQLSENFALPTAAAFADRLLAAALACMSLLTPRLLLQCMLGAPHAHAEAPQATPVMAIPVWQVHDATQAMSTWCCTFCHFHCCTPQERYLLADVNVSMLCSRHSALCSMEVRTGPHSCPAYRSIDGTS
mgnify:CR=1 FL=1